MTEREVGPPEDIGAAPIHEAPKLEMKVDQGALVPTNSTELRAIIGNISKGGGFPARFDTAEKRIAAYNLAHSLMGKRWQLILNNIANIHGQLCLFSEGPGALAEHTKEVAEKRMYLITKDYIEISVKNKNLDAEIWAGVCAIQRKGRALKEYFWTVDDARKAGQIPALKWDYSAKPRRQVPNPDSPWEKFFSIMMMRKAMNIAVKFEFPDAVVGVPIAESDFDEAPDLTDMREVNQDAGEQEDLNKSIENLP